MRLPELKQMRCFREVARAGHFGRAARTLAMSHSALSEQIQRLEDSVGQQLLERDRKGIKPTAEGTRFLEHVDAILGRVDEAMQAVRAPVRTAVSELQIGFSEVAFCEIVPAALRQLSREFPDLDLKMSERSGIDAERAIFDDGMDCLFVGYPPSNCTLRMRQIGEISLLVCLPRESPLCKKAIVELSDLHDQKIIFVESYPHRRFHDAFLEACEKAGAWPNIVSRAHHLQSVFVQVACGLGIGITQFPWVIPEEFGFEFRPLGSPQLTIPTIFARRPDQCHSLLDRLEEIFTEMMGP